MDRQANQSRGGGGRRGNNSGPRIPQELNKHKRTIIKMNSLGNENAEEVQGLLTDVKAWFEKNHEKINATFIRKLFYLIKGAKELIDLKLKVPEILYYAARQQDKERTISISLAMLYEELINQAETEEHVLSIHQFAECTIAYHTYFKEQSKR